MRGALQRRRIEPELLDTLPAEDPRARASRRDLAWINALMLQSWIMARLLRRHVSRPPRRILELGSGDGSFMLAVARRMGGAWRGVELVMIDQAELVTEARCADFAALGWRATPVVDDIFAWIARPATQPFDLICANLVLHHFQDQALTDLFASARALGGVFVATEPRRSAVSLAGCSMLRLIGVNDVTRHDAAASVRAGFAGNELQTLWPKGDRMRFEEHLAGLFTHAFAAEPIP